ncbi:hypothetical protein TBLA_0B07380 [Henningerozyma blattae CBS 6284]|uniref:nitric oxide dioxygenase n=1 Tax=Henningerozyma blattae (strain ATCC 34711 / CBS 6284 / DSM 70876 / NBRC 10599 / NRRL Y-10934 / UCD 77-7) TaxID=1071380 RepID=I2GZK4_HENB6|nr:hypothetical protein TBLA_0B07380 [Tetrapisispora blattae CBS 6284]CCH59556.1 hypothetical protein TBLA_0B07380 [Tetrapisispora blattae CBS 6284]
MLPEQVRTIIKATVPVLEQHGTTITKTFYKNMLNDHNELRNVFNRTNQMRGAQPNALATTVLAAAKHIDDLSPLLTHVRQIGHKHRALQIYPEQYDIVGEYLIKAIQQVLGPAATPQIIDAWTKAYGEIANVFIDVEKQMYKEAMWPGWKKFLVSAMEPVGTNVIKFTVTPKNPTDIILKNLPIEAGQYITVKTHPIRQDNKYDALRHYSLCSSLHDENLKFSVKLEQTENLPNGLVSEYLDLDVKVGDELELSAPAGDFTMNKDLIMQDKVPLVLLAAGVGATPLLAMLETQIRNYPSRPIYWFQSSQDEASEVFKKEVDGLLKNASSVKKVVVHTNKQPEIDAKFLKENIPEGADVYLCGPLGFMKGMVDHFKVLEFKKDDIHYEPFGPKMSTVKV